MNPRVSQYNRAVEELDAAVAAIRALEDHPTDADVDRAEARFRAAQAEAKRCKTLLEHEGSDGALDKLEARPDLPAPTRTLGGSGDLLRTDDGRAFRAYRSDERISARYDGTRVNGVSVADLSLGRALRGIVLGDWREADAEFRALAGTSATGGQTLLPVALSSQFIDLARAESVCSQAGMQTIDMTGLGQGSHHKIAKVTSDPAVSWVAESGTITPADPGFGEIEFVARKAVVLTKLSRELFMDAQNGDEIITSALTAALAVAIDAAALEGTGSGNNMPLGLSGITTVNGMNEVEMGTDGATPTNGASGTSGPAKLLEVVKAVRQDNAVPNAIVSSPRTWATFAGLKDTTYQPLRFGAGLDDLPWYTTTSVSDARTQGTSAVASNLYVGDFTQLILGVRQAVDVYVTRDAAMTTDELYIMVSWRGDVHPMRPSSFGRLVGILE